MNVYLPYYNNSFESLDNFRQILGEISAIIQDSNTNEVIVMGDFNVDFKCIFGEELMYFTADNALQKLMVYYVGRPTGLMFSPILAKHMVLFCGLTM